MKFRKDFSGENAKLRKVKISLPDPAKGEHLIFLGKAPFIGYVSKKEGTQKHYIHHFKTPLPNLYITQDKKTLILSGGRFKIKYSGNLLWLFD